MAITNEEISALFHRMAIMLEMKGDSIFKIRAYKRAAQVIDQLPYNLQHKVVDGLDLRSIPGVGKAISSKISEYIAKGSISAYEVLKSELPDGAISLMNIPGVGPKTAMLIAEELEVRNVDDLEVAILEGRVSELPRLGQKAAKKILQQIHSFRNKDTRTPLGVALPVIERIIRDLKNCCPSLIEITPAGSVRRWEETVGDIDIMGTSTDPTDVGDALVGLPYISDVIVHGPKKTSVLVDQGLQVDLRIVDEASFGALVQYFTGSQQHNVGLRRFANDMGLSLNEYGITDLITGEQEGFSNESDYYGRLGLQHIPPEIREGVAEIELAAKHVLPDLVRVSDIQGDLHMHSNWSDGKQPIDEMLKSASRFGHKYVAITDHSSGLKIANGLSNERRQKQTALLRSMDVDGLVVLAGAEVDIRADGSLDYPDDILCDLDVVIASIHSAMGQSMEAMTARIITAMRNPFVTFIGHPTARLIGSRDPVDVDMEVILQAAVETGTGLEINSSPERLDLKDTHVYRARELGVPLVVNTDSHSSDYLDRLRFGVGVARRGWCEPRHILNTLPSDQFMAYIRAPKQSRSSLFAARSM